MSSCLVLQQRNNLFIAGDTAISATVGGKRVRVSNDAKKVFVKDNHIIFCSGELILATKCKSFVENMSKLEIDTIKEFLVNNHRHEDKFELFIGTCLDNEVVSYQLSSYNGFFPVERTIQNNTEIFALGYDTEKMIDSFESNLIQTNMKVIDSMRLAYEANVKAEIGGNLDIIYFYNNEIHQLSYKIEDEVQCLNTFVGTERSHLVIAQALVGKLILGEKLQIGNENSTFSITADGLRVSDSNAVNQDRIFLGLEKQGNGTQKAVLRLRAGTGNNQLMLTEDGMYQMFQIHARDCYDRLHPFETHFYFPSRIQRLDEAKLIFKIEYFRAYSKGAQNAHQKVASATIGTNGGYSRTSNPNGGFTQTKRTSTSTASGAGVSPTNQVHLTASTTVSYDGKRAITRISPQSHYHTVVPSGSWHSHDVTISVGNHQHSVDISGHSHWGEVTIPAHGHEIIYGIYQYNQLALTTIYIDGKPIAGAQNSYFNSSSAEFNIAGYLNSTNGVINSGLHTVKVTSTSSANNREGLGRASITILISGFVTF